MKSGRRMGAPPKPYQPPMTPAGKVNVTDPDSHNVKTPRGYMQGYNVQGAVNEQQIVIAAQVTIRYRNAAGVVPRSQDSWFMLGAAWLAGRRSRRYVPGPRQLRRSSDEHDEPLERVGGCASADGGEQCEPLSLVVAQLEELVVQVELADVGMLVATVVVSARRDRDGRPQPVELAATRA
jgi:hypothetical protein